MSLARIVILLGLAIFPSAVIAAPPQPPLTNATIAEIREWQDSLWELQDNAFLLEDRLREFDRHLAAWKDATAVLDLEVVKVTKDGVLCRGFPTGGVSIRNAQAPLPVPESSGNGGFVLRIGDVVPLDVARRLRAGDQLVVRGTVATSRFRDRGGVELVVGDAKTVAVVGRVFEPKRADLASAPPYGISDEQRRQLMAVPSYPANALASGAAGEAVFTVLGDKVAVTQSAGNSALDEVAQQAMQRLGRNRELFQGNHRFRFDILAR